MGFRDSIIRSVISKYIERISPDECRKYITENKELLAQVTGDQWQKIRKEVNGVKVTLNYEEVITKLGDHRPDVLAVISCTDGGVDWIKRQIEAVNLKLSDLTK